MLREKGENLQKVDVKSVSRLVCELENDGLDICSRIDDDIFCTVVDALLQAPDSHEGERGLYLLAVGHSSLLIDSLKRLGVTKSR